MLPRVALAALTLLIVSSFCEGSDNCPATVINSFPYIESYVNLCTANNDYDFPGVLCSGDTREVVYRLAPTTSGDFEIYFVNLSDAQSVDFRMLRRFSGACPGDSLILCYDTPLAPGGTGRVSLGYIAAGEQQFLVVEEAQSCYTLAFVITDNNDDCPSSWTHECFGEFVGDSLNSRFDCNGGCANEDNGGVYQAQARDFASSNCGNCFVYNGSNGLAVDDDFYLTAIPQHTQLEITMHTEFTALVALFGGNGCEDPFDFFIAPVTTNDFSRHITECLEYDTILMQIRPLYPEEFEPLTQLRYLFWTDTFACPSCDYVDEYFVAPGTRVVGTTCGAGNDCNNRPTTDRMAQIYIPHRGMWTFGLCNSSPVWPAFLNLSETCCGPIIGQGVGGCPNGMAEIDGLVLNPGMYYLNIEGLNPGDCGNVTLSVQELTGRCCYGSEAAPLCADLTMSQCEALGGLYSSNETCAGEPCPVRPLCDREGGVSQTPHVPSEEYQFEATIPYWNAIDGAYEYYDLGEAPAVVQFWGRLSGGGGDCTESATTLRISFYSALDQPAQCAYDFTLTGTLLPFEYSTRTVYEWTAVLPELCSLTSGYIRIETVPDSCYFEWLSSPFGDGESTRRLFGVSQTLAYDLSLCVSGLPDVVINEVMYDDTASGNNDVDWVELHNTRDTPVNIGNWYLTDGSTYPNTDGEGVIQIPTGTTIPANGYIILSKVPFSAAAEVVCTEINASWTLNNSGDNLALYSDATSTSLVDGLLIGNYPDLAPSNSGTSVEKRSEQVAWTSDPNVWGASTNQNSTTGRYRLCTPGARNSVDATCLPPDSLTLRLTCCENQFELRYYSPGVPVFRIYYSTDMNAVFPNTFVPLVIGTNIPAGVYTTNFTGNAQGLQLVGVSDCTPVAASSEPDIIIMNAVIR